jgi:T-complex protein 1 subunit beta
VLAAELLKEAERLVAMRMHPQTIIAGYRRALVVAQEALIAVAKPSSPYELSVVYL